MRPQTLRQTRLIPFQQSRSLVDAAGAPVVLAGYVGVWEARYIQQLHGKATVAFSKATVITSNVSSVNIPEATLQSVVEGEFLWTHTVSPAAGGDDKLLGWGILVLIP